MLKNTYSPVETIWSSSAASIISRTVVAFAHKITTARIPEIPSVGVGG